MRMLAKSRLKKKASYLDFDRKFSNLPSKKKRKLWPMYYFFVALIGFYVGIFGGLALFNSVQAKTELLSPLPSPTPVVSPSPTPAAQFLPRAEAKPAKSTELAVDDQPKHTGVASFYSRSGCVGCSPTMTMANGQPLDDSKLTVAFNRSKLNSKVKITNVKNGQSVVATVTDRGGFEKEKFNVNGKQRIVDMTIATRDAINCSHLCHVEVEVL